MFASKSDMKPVKRVSNFIDSTSSIYRIKTKSVLTKKSSGNIPMHRHCTDQEIGDYQKQELKSPKEATVFNGLDYSMSKTVVVDKRIMKQQMFSKLKAKHNEHFSKFVEQKSKEAESKQMQIAIERIQRKLEELSKHKTQETISEKAAIETKVPVEEKVVKRKLNKKRAVQASGYVIVIVSVLLFLISILEGEKFSCFIISKGMLKLPSN